jgi:hypothetical protein
MIEVIFAQMLILTVSGVLLLLMLIRFKQLDKKFGGK